tara:strand:- start:3078 stop:3932 length:855 start_codon:yes stop_codon:yes gene_type:complete
MKIGLMLVGEKGCHVLKHIIPKHNVTFVTSYNDNGTNSRSYHHIKEICNKEGIRFITHERGKGTPNIINDGVDLVFVVGWQYLIKGDIEKYIVFHDSYLPEFKGWAPTVNYLIEGNPYLAATAFKPSDEMDSGDIIHRLKKYIQYPMKIKDAIKIVSDIYVEIIEDIINYKMYNNPKPLPVSSEKETFCIWRDGDDYKINWEWSSEKIVRFIDAVGWPYDGAYCYIENTKVEVSHGIVVKKQIIDQQSHIGKVFSKTKNKATIICGSNLLEIDIKLTNLKNRIK